MHCLVEFHPEARFTLIGDDCEGGWFIEQYNCPACEKMNLFLVNASNYQILGRGNYKLSTIASVIPVRPKGINRPPCPPEVPQSLAEDYIEGCMVLVDSPKASAALSRRCLQNLLRERAGVRPSNLADEIQELIDSKALPSHIIRLIDAVRNIGNFATHPMKSQRTGEILPVEPAEAELNLDVLEALFDFYFVQPTIIDRKRAAINAKLSEAGKPPMK
jgi:hypothetical protein